MSQHGSRPRALHETHILPVTALAWLDTDVVLSGEGSFLCAYNERRCIGQWQIFESQAIHGIVVDTSSGDILIYGGRFINIVRLSTNEKLSLSKHTTLQIDDWILDASFQDSQAAIVTAHNAVLTVDRRENDVDWVITPQVDGSNTILYSAHIQRVTKNYWLIAAGTAFGDVIVWSWRLEDATKTIHYSFSAHEGSTFGVRISDELPDTLRCHHKRVLASCSDDRTIRIWDISDLSSVADATFDRSTGFGSRDEAEDESRPALLAKAMGHVSRIWHVRFDQVDDALHIKSFGEDATTITWKLEQSDSSVPYKLVQTNVFSANAGKHIWSVANDAKGQYIVGGSDGAIAYVPVQHCFPQEQELECTSTSKLKDVLKAYAFLDEHTLVSTTQRGQIISYKLDEGQSVILDHFEQPDLGNYSIIATTSYLAFAAGNSGIVYAYVKGSSTLLPINCGQGKISVLLAQFIEGLSATALLTAKVNKLKASLKLFSGSAERPDLSQFAETEVNLPDDFNITVSTHISLQDGEIMSVLGSRNGMVAFYKHSNPATSISPILIALFHTETITSMIWHPAQHNEDTLLGHLFSSSRDGTYAIHEVHASGDIFKINLIHQLELPFGPHIGGLALLEDGQLLAWGFRSTHFVVYAVNTHCEIFTVECGGAHRNWAVWPRKDGLTFVWTKASKVFVKHFKQRLTQMIKSGSHGREVKSMAIKHNADGSALVATGAQDTNIRLFSVSATTSSLSCLHILRQHNTGPQHLVFSEEGDYLFSSGGFEEFFVWRLSYSCPIFGTGVVCESSYSQSGKSDLRIMGFEVKRNADDWQIVMAYSDSRVALWSYGRTQGWRHLIEADYLTSCPTAIIQTHDHYFTTATDGHLAFWEHSSDLFKWTTRHRAHQGAILCSISCQLSDSCILITGGDDSAVALTDISVRDTEMRTYSIPRAHAAAVTALTASSQGDVLYLVSAGLDQRLVLWEITIKKTLTARKLQIIPSGVADISSIDLLPGNAQTLRVFVSGIGVEVWTIALPLR